MLSCEGRTNHDILDQVYLEIQLLSEQLLDTHTHLNLLNNSTHQLEVILASLLRYPLILLPAPLSTSIQDGR